MRTLLMFPTKDNQITGNENQNPGNNCQVSICFHILFPPLSQEVNSDNKQTTYNSCEKISICNIPFNHNDSTFSINFNEIIIKNNVRVKAAINGERNSEIFCGRINKGAITPAANQATAMFPEISASFSSWSEENVPIASNNNMSCMGRQLKIIPCLNDKTISKGRKVAVLK